MDEELLLIEKLTNMIKLSLLTAKKSHDIIITESPDSVVALAYLSKATSIMKSAEALYYARFDVLARNEVEDIFTQFEVFSSEILDNVETNHSHQWTDIEFDRLIELSEYTPFSIS